MNTNVPASKIELYTGSFIRISYGSGLYDSLVSGNYRIVITAGGYEKYDSTVQVNTNTRTVKLINLSTSPIIGNWLSEGDNVAKGLRVVSKTKRVLAKFKTDFTYEIVITDSSDVQVTFEGTYSYKENPNTSILSIKLMQNVPSVLTNEGIFAINIQGILSMEYIQTSPPMPGFTPPTPNEGFGSTRYNGLSLGQTWIQKFVRN